MMPRIRGLYLSLLIGYNMLFVLPPEYQAEYIAAFAIICFFANIEWKMRENEKKHAPGSPPGANGT